VALDFTPQPLTEALRSISARTPVGSVIRSREWEDVPLALRQTAQFSAGISSARVLGAIQQRLQDQISLAREKLATGEEATFDRSSFIDAIRSIARAEGLEPEEGKGTITDITSIPRLGLIYDMQSQMAAGFARYKLDTSQGALLLWPAYRLGESTAREPRPLEWWQRRWFEAGQSVGWQGAIPTDFVALKTSPIWVRLSRFGTPWPPFDWGSTRELEEVGRDEAIELGLIREDWQPPEADADAAILTREMEASIADLSQSLRAKIIEWFGKQISVIGDTIKWTAS